MTPKTLARLLPLTIPLTIALAGCGEPTHEDALDELADTGLGACSVAEAGLPPRSGAASLAIHDAPLVVGTPTPVPVSTVICAVGDEMIVLALPAFEGARVDSGSYTVHPFGASIPAGGSRRVAWAQTTRGGADTTVYSAVGGTVQIAEATDQRLSGGFQLALQETGDTTSHLVLGGFFDVPRP